MAVFNEEELEESKKQNIIITIFITFLYYGFTKDYKPFIWEKLDTIHVKKEQVATSN